MMLVVIFKFVYVLQHLLFSVTEPQLRIKPVGVSDVFILAGTIAITIDLFQLFSSTKPLFEIEEMQGKQSLCLTLKERQRSRPSSDNEARSSQSSADIKSYIITTQLDPGVYRKHVEDTTTSNLTGFAFVVIGNFHLAGGKIT
uniref:Uncharacterized protein n=1 Tax=Lactuca sativa TaxID=4236 RepID=A0A9R1WE32_LACSA|nr:hypothetical protein LSAT_V11C200067820 [Lactuca sativa]